MKIKVLFVALSLICFSIFLVAPCIMAKPIKVAIVLPNPITDVSFSQSMYMSLVKVQEKLGKDNFEFAYSESMFVIADAGVALRDYATQGYDLVIGFGANLPASILEIAPDFPGTSFLLESVSEKYNEAVKGLTNVFGYETINQDPAYILGVVAAKITRSGIVGLVVPIKAGGIRRFAEGFEAGVKATKPDVEVLTNWTGSFTNLATAAEAAQTLINSGVDVMSGFSMIQIGAIGVAEKRGIYYLPTQCSSMMDLAPEIMPFGMYYDWCPMLEKVVAFIKQGVKGGHIIPIDLAYDGFKFMVNQEVFEKAIYGDVVEDIISGKIKLKK